MAKLRSKAEPASHRDVVDAVDAVDAGVLHWLLRHEGSDGPISLQAGVCFADKL